VYQTLTPSRPTRAADPTFEPVSLDDLKKHVELPLNYTQHDSMLRDLITVAREMVEHDTGIVGATGTFTWKLTEWPCDDWIELPIRPVSSVTSIQYRDTGGTLQTWSSAEYTLDNNRTQPIVFLNYSYWFPTSRGHLNDITLTLVAGYATQAAIPRLFKQAVLLAAAREFADREGKEGWTNDPRSIQSGTRAYEMLIRRLQRATYP
jgi:uncharacterized phiE125 gp8 family phage protein